MCCITNMSIYSGSSGGVWGVCFFKDDFFFIEKLFSDGEVKVSSLRLEAS